MQQQWIGNDGDAIKARLLDVAFIERPLRVVPMATDTTWSTSSIRAYAGQLGINDDDVGPPLQFSSSARNGYFVVARAFVGGRDVFVDPDVGLQLGKTLEAKHVAVDDVGRLVFENNVVAVYQHRPRIADPWLQAYVDRLRPLGHVLGCATAKVGMLFVSRDPLRIASIARRLETSTATRGLPRVS